MKILIMNWRWYPTGGDWTYVDNITKFYAQRGHEVIPFAMKNEKNFETPYSSYFINDIDYKTLNKRKNISGAFNVLKSTLYSTSAAKKLKELLNDHKIDLVHINNIHHYLTPSSLLPLIGEHNIPVIWTLHDYTILCPNTTFISHGAICERCKTGKFYNCVTNTCKKESLMASMVATAESYINSVVNPYQYVNYFICPSKFIESKFIEYGYDSNKFRQIYNPYNIISLLTTSILAEHIDKEKKYIVYVGNLLDVKGVLTLIKAAKLIDTDIYIIGDGEHKERFVDYKRENKIDNVYFLGKKTKEEVAEYVKNALMVVVPSEWYENLPYSLVEAMLLSKPVVGSNIGGIPELVIDNYTGYTFTPGNENELAAKINQLIADQGLLEIMGSNAFKHVSSMVNYDTFFKSLQEVFASLNLKL